MDDSVNESLFTTISACRGAVSKENAANRKSKETDFVPAFTSVSSPSPHGKENDNNGEETVPSGNDSPRTCSQNKTPTKESKTKKKASTITLPVFGTVGNRSYSKRPFDEDGEIHPDLSFATDVESATETQPITNVSTKCLLQSNSRFLSDEIDVQHPSQIEPLLIGKVSSTSSDITGIQRPHPSQFSCKSTPYKSSGIVTNTTPETQISPSSQEGFIETWSHASPHNHKQDPKAKKILIFEHRGKNEISAVSFLEEGSYNKALARVEDYGGDEYDHNHDSEDLISRRKHRRCITACFLFSLLMIATAAAIAVYLFLFNDGTGIRYKKQVKILISQFPSVAPTLEPSTSTVPSDMPSESPSEVHSDAPSVLPSEVPSDVPSVLPSEVPTDAPSVSPSGAPTDAPSVSPTDFPSTTPTESPATSFSMHLREYMYETFGVSFDNPAGTGGQSPAQWAVDWLNSEAQQADGRKMAMSPRIAQRFALLALEFSALNLATGSAVDDDELVQKSSGLGVREADRSNAFTTWNSQFFLDECTWTGVECNKENYVTGVRWAYREYTGSIPSELRILKNLTHLDLSNNYLQGPIPEELYYLTNLEKLYLFKNFLTGTLSTRIGNLDKITHFHLSHNQLTGPIPNELKSDGGSVDGIRPLGKLSS